MPSNPWRFLLSVLILLLLSQVGVEGSLAQSAFTATLTIPDTSGFPHLTAYLDVHDPSGAFVHGLSPQDVILQENGVQVPAGELQEQKPGVQFAIAITPGESFIIRDALGISRYNYLLQGLLAGTWADRSPGADDFSLLTMDGPQLTHSSDPAELKSSLEKYLPDDPNAIPSLEVLASALQVVSDPAVRKGMERAILFITPPQEIEISLGLQSIIASAIQQNIHIYVWLVASEDVFNLPVVEQLRNLAYQTQATFFAFSHDESVPDLEIILEPLRYIYQLEYDSKIVNPGPQQVSAQVSIGSESVTTDPKSFELDLQAPVPVLLSPPLEIVRTYSTQPAAGEANLDTDLLPVEQVITIQVTFPDGYNRDLTRTNLYVDGALIAENTSPPFDQFVWDLTSYTQDGEHILSAEAVDNLGMIGKTVETSIKISVPSTTQSVMVAFSQKRLLLVGVVILVSASILVLVLILGGRIHPKPHPGQVNPMAGSSEKTRPAGYRERMRQRKDPVTQPVKIASVTPAQTKPRSKSWKARLPWIKPRQAPVHAFAYLIPLVGFDETTIPAPLQITAEDVSLGTDPLHAGLVITDPSIEGVHARIHREGKTFLITDAGSVAGTWVNFKPVSPSGTTLEHADIIHLGQVGFRFNLPEPDRLRKVVVTPLEPDV